MMSLGTLLVKHGWITKQQLGLAISRQREVGGRLGTCLLEMGAVTEDLLNRSLAEQQGVPTATASDLAHIEEKVSRLLPAPIAIRYRAVPFRANHSDVDIAMLEVDNLWLQDELSFIVGRRLSVYIASEARIIEALSRYYNAPCSERFIKLLTGLNRELRQSEDASIHPESRLARDWTDASAPQVSTPAPGPAPEPAEGTDIDTNSGPIVLHPAAPPVRSIPVSSEELQSIGARPASDDDGEPEVVVLPTDFHKSPDVDTESTPGLSLAEAEEALESSSDPQDVGRVLVAALSRLFTRACLLQVSPAVIRGWLGHGPGLDETRLRDFVIPTEQPSIFLNLREGGSFFLGTLPAMPAHQQLAACWHKDLADECVVFPVRVREKLVLLVYGDRGPLGLTDLDIDAVRGLCASAARAFEQCIVERKRRGHTPAPRQSSGRHS